MSAIRRSSRARLKALTAAMCILMKNAIPSRCPRMTMAPDHIQYLDSGIQRHRCFGRGGIAVFDAAIPFQVRPVSPLSVSGSPWPLLLKPQHAKIGPFAPAAAKRIVQLPRRAAGEKIAVIGGHPRPPPRAALPIRPPRHSASRRAYLIGEIHWHGAHGPGANAMTRPNVRLVFVRPARTAPQGPRSADNHGAAG